jgi:transketolase
MDHSTLTGLQHHAAAIRRLIIDSIYKAQTGHAGPSLSLVEVLTLLYFRHMDCSAARPDAPERDRLILSKGHASPVLYATLAHAGYFPLAWLDTLRGHRSALQGHPKAGALPGVEVSTGSLGQGLSIALGLALGLRRQRLPSRVFCIVGDGEMQEGQNWEAMMAAAALGAARLTVIVDRNGLQNDGPTEQVMPLGSLVLKAEAFGWSASEIDGHDFAAIERALLQAQASERPFIIVANTIKGCGVSFMQGSVKWHHHPLSEAEYLLAKSELAKAGP